MECNEIKTTSADSFVSKIPQVLDWQWNQRVMALRPAWDSVYIYLPKCLHSTTLSLYFVLLWASWLWSIALLNLGVEHVCLKLPSINLNAASAFFNGKTHVF